MLTTTESQNREDISINGHLSPRARECKKSSVTELVQTYRDTLTPLIIQLGREKMRYPRTHEVVVGLEEQINDHGYKLADQYLRSEEGDTLSKFYQTAEKYVEGSIPLDALRTFIDENYSVTFQDSSQLKEDVSGRKVVCLLNHYRQGPEVIGFPRGDLGSNLEGHDFAPILAKLLLDQGLAGSSIDMVRFGKPLFPHDQFYYRSAQEVGTFPIQSEGVGTMANDFQRIWSSGKIPTVCPEAGLRSLEQWKTGGLVGAALANADGIVLLTQSPLISAMDRTVDFHYVGYIPIPEDLKQLVHSRQSPLLVQEFNNGLKRVVGEHLVKVNYHPVYTEAVAAALKKKERN